MARILYIEDNPVSGAMLTRRLGLEGHAVQVATDGETGLKVALADRPDLILLDMSLPGMDGWQLVEKLKADPAARHVPVIALTAHAMEGDRERCLAAGCDDYDTKPVDMARLLGKIGARLAEPPPRESPAPGPSTAETRSETPGAPRVLLVEDDENSRDFLSRRIALEGFTVETAPDGARALERLDHEPYDLVLLDVMLPLLSGLDVLVRIRARWSMVERPVIMVTARDRSQDVVEALRLGANDYVSKPVDVAVLLARLSTHLRVAALEKELRAEKEFSDNLIQNARLMIIAVDRERRITQFNRAAEETFGYRAEDLLGQPVDVLYADPAEGRRVHAETLSRDGYTGEVTSRRKDGRTFPAYLTTSPVRDDRGRLVGCFGISSDITQEKQLAAERQALARLKDDFLAIASHDLKNPLNSILGFATLLERELRAGEPVPREARQMARSIHRSGEVMHKIVTDFIDFQALEGGRLTLARVPTDLGAMMEQARDGQSGYARRKEIRIVVAPGPALPDVPLDPDRIAEVLANLINNAVKFSPPESSVSLRALREPEVMRVEVSDQGPGLTPDDLSRVFGKYARLSAKPTGGEKSSGLGLSICKLLVELHGGEIGVRNNPDRGATFWFTLPLGSPG